MRIFYLPLESYRERYTEMLQSWVESRWSRLDRVQLITINGRAGDPALIRTGAVLDAQTRSCWSTTQVAALVDALVSCSATADDVIYLEDMFTPGYEAIPYLLDQRPARLRPRIFVRNHAQSMDPDDFTHQLMRPWMRRYEQMVYDTADTVFCASSVHLEMMKIANLDLHHAAVSVVGLPHDEADVRARAEMHPDHILSLNKRPPKVIYSSRFDEEKQPNFFMDIVERMPAPTQFVLCTGSSVVRGLSDDVDRLADLEERGKITVMRSCTKRDYYRQLATSRVQINTARQDFVSNTAIEASAFGTPTLAPAFRSFPETLRNNANQLYVPWSVDDACARLTRLLYEMPETQEDIGWLSRVHDKTLDRILAVMQCSPIFSNWWELP